MSTERPLSPWDLPAGHPGLAYLTGRTPLFALAADPRFSYCLYVPREHNSDGPPRPLVVAVHGTRRQAETLRDAFADFAEQHNCVVLVPLFPAALTGPNDLDSYKLLTPAPTGIRADETLLAMVDEVTARWHVDGDRFHLHGFSGGGQFAHRFAYLHPGRLASLSVGAPGRVTLLDPALPWWRGTADMRQLFGTATDMTALTGLPIQLVIGEHDMTTKDLAPDTNAVTGQGAGADAGGVSNRTDSIHALHANWRSHGIHARLDTVAGAGHNHHAVLPAVQRFIAEQLAI
jgi:poly(3-hydroxybutyrate) depolymerase